MDVFFPSIANLKRTPSNTQM